MISEGAHVPGVGALSDCRVYMLWKQSVGCGSPSLQLAEEPTPIFMSVSLALVL